MYTHPHTIKGRLFYFSNLAVANNAAVKWVHRYLFEMLISMLHAELLQSCASLCDPVDGNLPGSSIHVILQARILSGLPCPLWIYTREWGYWIIWHSIFNFLIKRSIFHNGWIILHSYQQVFTTSSPTFVILVFLMIALLTGVRWYLIVIFIYISLMVSKFEHLFKYILAICISSLENFSFQVPGPF